MRKTRKFRIIILTMIGVLLCSTFCFAGNVKVHSAKTSVPTKTVQKYKSFSMPVSYSYTGDKSAIKIEYKSDNTKVASVSANGVVYGCAVGKTKIHANVQGIDVVCSVSVIDEPPKVIDVSGCYTYLNNYRKAYNKGKAKSKQVAMLKRDKNLEKLALIRAKEMATTGKFSHVRPNGKRSLTLIPGNVYKGENIARGQVTCAQVSTAWYNSSGHRTNMLRGCFKKVGIAAYRYHGVTYWCQLFSS